MNLSAIAAVVLTPLILRYLFKSAPIDSNPDEFPAPSQLETRWNKAYMISSILSLPVIALGIYLTWLIMSFISDLVAVEEAPESIVYKIDNISLLLPALFSGFFVAALIMVLLEKLLLTKAQLREFIYYQNIKSGGDMRKILSRMIMVILPASLLLFVYMVDQYAVFSQDKIRINTFSTMNEKIYVYQQVRQITSTQVVYKNSSSEQETGREHEIAVLFDDGDVWSSSSGGKTLDATLEKNQKLLHWLQQKTGLNAIDNPIKTVWQN